MPERKVYFFRIHSDLNDDGTGVPYDASPALTHIDGLPFDHNGRYMGGGDQLTCCWVDFQTQPERIRLGKIRRGDLPAVEQQGNLHPLPLDLNEGIVEQTHFVFFPNNIVGMLFNYYGPRVASLREYLRRKHPATPDTLRIDPLLRQDMLEQLDQFGEIRILNLAILRPFLNRLEDADQTLHDAFQAADRIGEAEQLQIVLRPRPHRRDWLGRTLIERVRNLAELVTGDPDAREDVTRLRVKGLNTQTESVETIDLLKEHLVREKTVVRQAERSRSIDPQSAYRAIQEAHAELEDQLQVAAAVFQ